MTDRTNILRFCDDFELEKSKQSLWIKHLKRRFQVLEYNGHRNLREEVTLRNLVPCTRGAPPPTLAFSKIYDQNYAIFLLFVRGYTAHEQENQY